MVVVRHQAVGQTLPRVFEADFAESLQEQPSIAIAQEDIALPVPAVGHVVVGARKRDSNTTWHRPSLSMAITRQKG
jgi:hypothetical protein